MDEFRDSLETVIGDPHSSAKAKETASSMLERWDQGVTPSGKELQQLSKATAPSAECARISGDGACGWLRKHGKRYELTVAPPGQRAMCCFPKRFDKCPGFKQAK